MNIPPKPRALLGFAKKAGHLQSGESAVSSAMKKKTVKLLIIANDLPAKRKVHWQKWCEANNIDCVMIGTKQEYGYILGLSARSILAITDRKMADAIIRTIRTKVELHTEI